MLCFFVLTKHACVVDMWIEKWIWLGNSIVIVEIYVVARIFVKVGQSQVQTWFWVKWRERLLGLCIVLAHIGGGVQLWESWQTCNDLHIAQPRRGPCKGAYGGSFLTYKNWWRHRSMAIVDQGISLMDDSIAPTLVWLVLIIPAWPRWGRNESMANVDQSIRYINDLIAQTLVWLALIIGTWLRWGRIGVMANVHQHKGLMDNLIAQTLFSLILIIGTWPTWGSYGSMVDVYHNIRKWMIWLPKAWFHWLWLLAHGPGGAEMGWWPTCTKV